jgi:hypothetical protein
MRKRLVRTAVGMVVVSAAITAIYMQPGIEQTPIPPVEPRQSSLDCSDSIQLAKDRYFHFEDYLFDKDHPDKLRWAADANWDAALEKLDWARRMVGRAILACDGDTKTTSYLRQQLMRLNAYEQGLSRLAKANVDP